MAKKFISVRTRRPAEVTAYLYQHTEIVAEINAETHTDLILRTTADESNVQFLAQYQADRLSSGLHGAVVFDDILSCYSNSFQEV